MKYRLKRFMRLDDGDEVFDTREEAEEAAPVEIGATSYEIEEVPETADEKGEAARRTAAASEGKETT